tara:strand:+ start:146 stop:697 length:552 start_codon:yes stop_codon:yes gene_type:complete
MNKENFIKQLSNLKSASTFLSIMGYRNEFSEIANYNITFNMSYKNALLKSIKILNKYQPTSDSEMQAKLELLNSFNKSLSNLKDSSNEELSSPFNKVLNDKGLPIKGLKVNSKTDEIYLYGLVVHKKVVMPGLYPNSSKKEFTVIKDKLKALCPVSKYRQFKMSSSQVNYISVQKNKILPPSV